MREAGSPDFAEVVIRQSFIPAILEIALVLVPDPGLELLFQMYMPISIGHNIT
jgi:hypothetical protein